jgi:hypothetical protein
MVTKMVNELQAIFDALGGTRVFKRTLANVYEMQQAIHEGFPSA